MLYRENGQFKTSYRADQQIFPILQDRIAIVACSLALAVRRRAAARRPSTCCARSSIPFLILSLAALGLNILVGYCGQISLGTGAFMAVGAYAAYNFQVRIDGMPLVVSLLLGGVCATVVGVLFGIPSLRIKGLYLAVATLAAQFFVDWAFLRIKLVHQRLAVGLGQRRRTAGVRLPDRVAGAEVPVLPGLRDRVRAAGEEPGARRTSAANGWRSATWTSPPR